MSLPARVGLVLAILAAVILITIVTTYIILRIQRGPGVTFWALFNRQPIPKRPHPSPDTETGKKDPHKDIISPVPTAHIHRTSLHKELQIDTSRVRRQSTRSSLPQKSIRTMSETNLKDEKLQVQPLQLNRMRASTRSSGTIPSRLYPPSEFSVPDSPVIVLPSPSDLQKFRINVNR
ncbi:hypothetical protein ASPCADRAFT_671 [Aspergillus carbonarius ITEM 5010]|uniref:Uncharacterized protein n=1 Tax=Aspergillus carbonarius (strain ITEM 5010) TaxID=602072 RepID=A0A1R3S2H3_ASPC5|nr:hypothetical protein ASPCADRAFT_671 [Aspergillus carbonarius ITEM 5010]